MPKSKSRHQKNNQKKLYNVYDVKTFGILRVIVPANVMCERCRVGHNNCDKPKEAKPTYTSSKGEQSANYRGFSKCKALLSQRNKKSNFTNIIKR